MAAFIKSDFRAVSVIANFFLLSVLNLVNPTDFLVIMVLWLTIAAAFGYTFSSDFESLKLLSVNEKHSIAPSTSAASPRRRPSR